MGVRVDQLIILVGRDSKSLRTAALKVNCASVFYRRVAAFFQNPLGSTPQTEHDGYM